LRFKLPARVINHCRGSFACDLSKQQFQQQLIYTDFLEPSSQLIPIEANPENTFHQIID
jgi:hypothetical protein